MGSWDRMDTIQICCLILPPGDKQKFGKITERGTKIPVFNKSEVSLNAQCTGEWKKKKMAVAVLKPHTEEAASRNSACIS